MQMPIEIIVPANEDQWRECRDVHFEYVKKIGAHPLLQPYFTAKNFREEIDSMPRGYEPPDGVCLIAYLNAVVVGTVALRRLNEEICEMKRLYVKPQGRGAGVGARLIEKIIEEGRKLGFSKMRLDNSRSAMAKANELYKELGFYEIDRYNENFVADACFMEKKL